MSLRRVVGSALLVTAGLLIQLQAMASEHHGQVLFGGLPVPGAVVTASQGDKKMTAVTNDVGVYAFPDLPDGNWTLQVQMTGFAPVKQDVSSGPNAAADKIELKALSLDDLRAAAKPVKVDPTVAAPPPAIAAATEPAGAAENGKSANGKAAGGKQQASAAAPGAPPPPPPPQDAAAQQASDGFLINGSVNNSATSQYAQSAAIGNARSGGRSLYNWGLSATLENSALDARSYSLTALNSPKPSYTNLQLGANFGGPLHFKHFIPLSKAPYVYLFYQRGTTTNATTYSELLPTLAERGGDLSAVTTPVYAPKAGLSAGCLAAGVTPGQPFAGNVIPAPCFSSAAVRLLKLYPTPNLTGDPKFNYQVPLTNDSHSDAFRTFAQKNIGNKNFLNGTFQWRSTRSGNNNLFGFHDSTRVTDYSANVAWNHRFTQRINSNINYTFSREHSLGNPFFAYRENIEAEAGISGVLPDAAYWGPPSLGFSSGIYGLTDAISSNNRDQTHAVGAQVTWTHGRHEIAGGGDFRRQQFNYLTQQNPRGSFQFTGSATSGGGHGGSDFADLLLGIPDTSAIAYGNADKYFRQSVYDLYVRDNFRVNPELTINAGVRWEYGAPITEIKNRLVNLDFSQNFTAAAPVVATSPTGPVSGTTYPRSLIHPDRSGILPNISVAWRPISGSSLLVRSSYQWYNDTSVYQRTALAMAQQAPLSTSLNLDNSRCALTLTNAFGSCASSAPDNFAVDPHFRVGYAQIWQLSLQRDLPAALQATVTYRGTKGTRGVQEILPNTYPYD
ncbi:MAG TPA: TonB-dependent receptor, partial [Acidobacteriaceae bacterium]|nr:TonB-dependent receptor [Acidobacteriaceae bacterium]